MVILRLERKFFFLKKNYYPIFLYNNKNLCQKATPMNILLFLGY